MMLESHNDSAVAIAEHVGGSVENFAAMMNDKARSLDVSLHILLRPMVWTPPTMWAFMPRRRGIWR